MSKSKIGGYRQRKLTPQEIDFADFVLPWNFYMLFASPQKVVIDWMRTKGLLASPLMCPRCATDCSMVKREGNIDSYIWRCTFNKKHEYSIRKFSFFYNSKLTIQDMMDFIRSFLIELSLHRMASNAGINYSTTSVRWAHYIREIFMLWYDRTLRNVVLQGEVEIDESLFGRSCKYHKGKKKGSSVWIFGLVERATNRLLLFPVDRRDESTLCQLVEQYVAPGSTIDSDCWAAYNSLNDRGYSHFTVCHKHTFSQLYKNVATGEKVTVHTNQIEGAWSHAKKHFKQMNGTSQENFQGHLCEILFRNHHSKQNIFEAFFEQVKQVYDCTSKDIAKYNEPLFPTWHPSKDDSIIRNADLDDDDLPFDNLVDDAMLTSSSQDDPASVSSVATVGTSATVTVDASESVPVSPPTSHSVDASNCVPELHQPGTDALPSTSSGRTSSDHTNLSTRDMRYITMGRRRKLKHPQQYVPLFRDHPLKRLASGRVSAKGKEAVSSRGRILRKKNFSWADMSTDSDFEKD